MKNKKDTKIDKHISIDNTQQYTQVLLRIESNIDWIKK